MTYPQPGTDPQQPYPGQPTPAAGYGQPQPPPPVYGQPYPGPVPYPQQQPAYGQPPVYPQQPAYGQQPYPMNSAGMAGQPQQGSYYAPAPPFAPAGYATPAGPRPTTVTAAAMFMLAIPVLQVIAYAASLAATSAMKDNMRRVFEDAGIPTTTIDQYLSDASFGGSPAGIVSLIMALIVGGLAIFNLRGVNGARIATWVLLGLGLAAGLCTLGLLFTVQSTLDSLARSAGTSLDMGSILPGWYLPFSYLQGLASVVIYVTVIVLLARPASNEYFRRP